MASDRESSKFLGEWFDIVTSRGRSYLVVMQFLNIERKCPGRSDERGEWSSTQTLGTVGRCQRGESAGAETQPSHCRSLDQGDFPSYSCLYSKIAAIGDIERLANVYTLQRPATAFTSQPRPSLINSTSRFRYNHPRPRLQFLFIVTIHKTNSHRRR